MKVYNQLLNIASVKGAAYLMLLDPDKIDSDKTARFIKKCEDSGVDGFLMGGSLMMGGNFENSLKMIKSATKLPVIIFPGGVEQVCTGADAILFLSVISGRNPEHLIGKHVMAAPIIKRVGLEAISTGYILVESGVTTTAQYLSGSVPVPRNKPEIAAATALAGEYLGMKLIYLEAGSGADNHVPVKMVKTVSEYCSVPLVVGGGIKTPGAAREIAENGAKIIVTGNHFEDENNWGMIKDFAAAVHHKMPIVV